MQSVILGTAQWGLDYGATNIAGRLSDAALTEVVEHALALGIGRLDTAPAYGDSETRVGHLGGQFCVQTKILASPSGPKGVRASLEASLERLDRASVAAVLVHDWADVTVENQPAIASALEELRGSGLCAAVGVSAYGEAEVEAALEAFDQLDVVQVPASILDQRLAGSGVLDRARSGGTRVQARSIFLQGAALAEADHPRFGMHPDVVRLRSAGVAPISACLGWVAAQPWIDELVLGVSSAEELDELMAVWAGALPVLDWSSFVSADPWLIDPRRWTAPTGA